MGKPQKPELDRSGHTPVDQGSAKERTGRPSAGHAHGTDKGGKGGGRGGGVPPEQRPPHPT
ncbi:MAG TPA: hypothetical protein VIS06_06225 [Mycobacteriales bacterium]